MFGGRGCFFGGVSIELIIVKIYYGVLPDTKDFVEVLF